jgi:hypothetical protein
METGDEDYAATPSRWSGQNDLIFGVDFLSNKDFHSDPGGTIC